MDNSATFRLMKKHGIKWESRSFVISPHTIAWSGKKKNKTIKIADIAKIVESEAAPNSLLKKCAFAVEVRGTGKVFTLCAASQRQKLDVVSKIEVKKGWITLVGF
jgi:hypothetical protein